MQFETNLLMQNNIWIAEARKLCKPTALFTLSISWPSQLTCLQILYLLGTRDVENFSNYVVNLLQNINKLRVALEANFFKLISFDLKRTRAAPTYNQLGMGDM